MELVEISIGEMIDRLYDKRAERLERQREVDALQAEEESMKKTIVSLLEASSLEGAKGGIATASITRRTVANPVDWDKFYRYVKENDAFDLLHKRISDNAYRDRLEQGEAVPGLEPFTVVGLSLTKSSRK